MSLLGILGLGFINPDFIRQVFGTVAFTDQCANFIQCLGCECDRVGTHVGDQTDTALVLVGGLKTFIQTLCRHHRTLRREAELTRRFLLQCRGRKRRGRITLALLLGDAAYADFAVSRSQQCVAYSIRLLFINKAELLDLFVLIFSQTGGKAGRLLVDGGFNRPVFLFLERINFFFTLDNQPERG